MEKKLNELASEVRSYFDDLAQSSTLIGYDGVNDHFLSLGIEEIVNKPDLDFGDGYGLVMEMIDGKLSGKHRNDSGASAAIGLWFLKHVTAKDYTERANVTDETYRVGMQFMAKMKMDQEQMYEAGGEPAGQVIHYFDLDDVDTDVAGPVGDQYWGYRFEFMVKKEGVLHYDEELWV